MEPVKPDLPAEAPKPSKNAGAKLVVALVTLATIVGGVAAGFQIYEYLRSKPAPARADGKAAENRIELGDGLSVILPPDWQKVDREAMDAVTRGFSGVQSTLPSGPGVNLHFVKERRANPDAPSALAMLGSVQMKAGETLEGVLESFRRHPGCQSASIVETAAGPAARAILYYDGAYPDGAPMVLVMDVFIRIAEDQGLMAFFYTEPSEHLDQAPTFRQVFESLRAE